MSIHALEQEWGYIVMLGPTRDHGEILAWAEKHRAVPAEVHVFKFDGEPAVLRFLFETELRGTPEIRPISWPDFFARFDLMGLALVYDDSPSFQLLQVEGKSPYEAAPDPF